MTKLARGAALLVVAVAAVTVPTMRVDAANPGTGCGPRTGQIEVSDLARGTNVVSCKVVGRDLDLGPLVLEIPAPGEGVAVTADSTTGDGVSASVETTEDGRVLYDSGTASDSGTSEAEITHAKNGCDSNYLGALKAWTMRGTLDFWVGDGGQPGAGTKAQTGAAIERAGDVWHFEKSPCFAADRSRAPSVDYVGNTSYEGDFRVVDGNSTCAERDHKSTVDAGNLDDPGRDTTVALNCTWWNDDDRVLESDIRFNTTEQDFTYTPFSHCSGDYDVWSIMTHEIGHSYGMKDKSGAVNRYQTMHEEGDPCTSHARNLGRSDVRHLRAKYRW